MKIIKILFFSFLFASLLASCDQSSNEKQKSAGERVGGTVQETVGKMTNDDQLKNDGKKNKLKGDLRSTKEDVKDAIVGE